MSDLISREVKLTLEDSTAYTQWCASSKLTRGDCPLSEAQIARLKRLSVVTNAPAIEQGEAVKPQFPTMLRKMWSGGEVQEWIDENWTSRYTTPQQPQEQGELVRKAVADALEDAAKICDEAANQYQVLMVTAYATWDEEYAKAYDLKAEQCQINAKQIRALIKRNAKVVE